MNKIELIIFDLDGTLYNLSDVVEMNYYMQLDFYSKYMHMDKEEVEEIFEHNNIFKLKNDKSKSATEFFIKQGIPAVEWNKYREENFDVSAIKKVPEINDQLLNEFRKIAPLVLLSSNSLSNIKRILRHLQIDGSLFEEIVCSDNMKNDGEFKKIDEMKKISEERNINCENILSIGDRYKTDIEPILSLGGMGIVVNAPKDLKAILDKIKF